MSSPSALRIGTFAGTLTASLVVAACAVAQVVINVPDADPPRLVRDGETVNFLPGGSTFSSVEVEQGGILNVRGGTLFRGFVARPGSLVNLEAGLVDEGFTLAGGNGTMSGGRAVGINVGRAEGIGSQLLVTGGALGELTISTFSDGARATLEGFDFKLNGMPIAGLGSVGQEVQFNVPRDSVFTGVLSDGTPFALLGRAGMPIRDDSLFLRRSATVDVDPQTFVDPGDLLPLGLRGPQKLVLNDPGFRLPEFYTITDGAELEINDLLGSESLRVIDSTVNHAGGRLGRDVYAAGNSVLNISGETSAGSVRAFDETEINMTGGDMESFALAGRSKINITGGFTRGLRLTENAQAEVTGGYVRESSFNPGTRAVIRGGNFGFRLTSQGADVTIHGGAFGDQTRFYSQGTTTFHGTDFHFNGVPLSGLANPGDTGSITINSGDVFSGTFADGTPFVFSDIEDRFEGDPIQLVQSAAPAAGPTVIDSATDDVPLGIRDGQTLIVREGTTVAQNFNAGPGSVVRIEGGFVDENIEANGAEVILNSGTGLRSLGLFNGASLVVNGGETGPLIRAYRDATITVNGGRLGSSAEAVESSTWVVNGGELDFTTLHESNFTLNDGSVDVLQLRTNSDVVVNGGEIGNSDLFDSDITVRNGDHGQIVVSEGSSADLQGGRVRSLTVQTGGHIEVHGGNYGAHVGENGGSLKIFGGTFADSFNGNGGVIEFYGSDFQIDGVSVTGLDSTGNTVQVTIPDDAHFTGTLSDGTPFSFVDEFTRGFNISNSTVRLIQQPAPAASTAPQSFDNGQGPLGARRGETIVLEEGGFFDDNFVAGRGSTVVINGGEVGNNFEAVESNVTINGGSIGDELSVLADATVTIHGGTVQDAPEVYPGGTLHIAGGVLASGAFSRGGNFEISSGQVESSVRIFDGGQALITGGTLHRRLNLAQGTAAQVNGGVVRLGTDIEGGASLVIDGGRTAFDADSGASVKVYSGTALRNSRASAGSQVELRGGGIGDGLNNFAGEAFEIYGQHFEIDGVPIAGLDQPGDTQVVSISEEQLFTGTLSAGNPFVFTRDEDDRLNTVKLIRTDDLPRSSSPLVIDFDAGSTGAYQGRSLRVVEGGTLGESSGAGRGSRVSIEGGVVGPDFEAYAAEVEITGGQVGFGFDAFLDSRVVIEGGQIREDFQAHQNAIVELRGGWAQELITEDESRAALEGGRLERLETNDSSQVVWRGGAVGAVQVTDSTASLEIQGSNFQFNGAEVSGLDEVGDQRGFNIPTGSYLSGTLTDGTPFLLSQGFSSSRQLRSSIATGTLTLVQAESRIFSGPALINVSDDQSPLIIGRGQRLVLEETGMLPDNFLASEGSELIVSGTTGFSMKSLGAKVILDGGTIEDDYHALHDTELVVKSGELNRFHLHANSRAEIRGGTISESFLIDSLATVNIYGTSFMVNGQPIRGFEGITDTYVERRRGNFFLEATLTDGSLLRWSLDSIDTRRGRGISPNATLIFHLVPEPTSAGLILIMLMATLTKRRQR